jgi:hypothetical protein
MSKDYPTDGFCFSKLVTDLVLAAVSIGALSGAVSGTLSGESQVLVDEELAGGGVGSGAQSETDDDD